MGNILAFAREQCANHLARGPWGIQDFCLLEPAPDFRCFFTKKGARLPRCRYYEESVLPADPKLEALYWAERKAEAGGYVLSDQARKLVVDAAAVKATCARCGREFTPTSNRQRYCSVCSKEAKRESVRKAVLRQRNAKSIKGYM